jgi:uncharacterized protein (DUF58 family)
MTHVATPPPAASGGVAAAPSSAAAEVLRRLELTVTRPVDGLLHGDHLGRLPGLGSEAGETRRYLPGDDPRRIDWNVTAREQAPHVRDAIAERELETWLVVDLSASTDFGTARCTKRDLVVTAAGAVALLASRAGDRVGAVVLTSTGLVTLPARSGGVAARALFDAVAAAPLADRATPATGGRPDLGDALDVLARRARHHGLAVVVSDFAGAARWAGPLRQVTARHETIAVEVLDPRELDLPDVGLLVVIDTETGEEREVRTDDADLRRRYAAASRAQRRAASAVLRERAVDHLVLRTDGDAAADLVGWLAQRPRRLVQLRRQRIVGAVGGRRP